jgi:transcriptional antiterminator
MDAETWSERTDFNAVCRRAGGRRGYNYRRQFCAEYRRLQLSQLWDKNPPLMRGMQSRLAEELGVSRSTISRDLKRLRRRTRPCHTCGATRSSPA